LGTEVKVEAGVSFPVDATVSASVKAEFTAALQRSTGSNVMNGNSTTLSYTLGIESDQKTIATFIPNYQCYTGPYDCATDKTTNFVACIPELDPSTGAPRGEYSALVTD
jgi:hypothetical protein